jgi:hypothetical protein
MSFDSGTRSFTSATRSFTRVTRPVASVAAEESHVYDRQLHKAIPRACDLHRDAGGLRYIRRMNLTKTSIALAAFLAGCAASAVASQFVIPSARAGTNSTRWEYFCFLAQPDNGLRIKSDLDAFNRAGAEGWELATAGGNAYCFKRQLP